ncbi:hypothetical protein BJV77DRAFT_264052 [Russula vinacea]|nr:hypothetical protein BJV77DRAFT_264052 [Russula vinacea]
MKSLLRKKTPTDNIKKPSSPSSTQHARQPPTIETPLYARFASTASTKTAAQPLEPNRPVVSGPMPLGRPTRAHIEADNRRKHEEESPSRRRLSRRVHTGPESLPGAREVQSSINRPSQDVPVDLPRPSMKAQVASFSDEELDGRGLTISQLPRMYNIAAMSSPLLPYPPILNN